jgi:class 3 adenylate cyclase/tetratricopeptide (TPR) repeat protein
MVQSSRPSIQIDLSEFKLHLHLKSKNQLTLHFNSPSRRFYLSVIALVVNEMKKLGRIISIPLQEHLDLLILLNESVGGSAGSSDRENLLNRIYRKWKDALPNLEEAPLFKVLGKKKEGGDGAVGKIYSFTEAEKDGWANLFEYMGSEENVRLKFAVDKIGVGLNETSIIFGDSLNAEAWDQFIFSLKNGRKEESEPVKESAAIDYSKPRSYTPKSLADKILTIRSSIEGERKPVTVFFADVANYASMFENLDPDEVHQIVDGCFKILMDGIHKYEGTINQFTGDGVMALFGAPIAHEDHAQRACRSALDIQRAMEGYGQKIRKGYGLDFRLRIGLNSGPVIVGPIGDDLRMHCTAIGDTTNLAARVEQAAKPGEVWISQETRHIIWGYFKEESVGEIALKGKAQPQHLYRLISDLPEVRTTFAAGLARGMTDLVGRRPEMEALQSAYERVRGGEAQVVGVVGEAGVGKSRLVYEFQKNLGTDETCLTGFCLHYGRSLNFLPVIDVVKAAFGIVEGMSEEEVGNRIMERAKNGLASMVPFYRNLISLKVDDPGFNLLDPEGRKFGTFEAVKNLLLAMSEEKPLVILLEDVHWMDKISEEYFTYFSRCIHGHKIMMISAYRPEGTPPWSQSAHYQRLGLETLSFDASIRLVRNILGGLSLDPALEKKIVEKTEGNPFFVEEMVRALLDRGDLVKSGDRYICTRPIYQLEIPNTIQGVLAARMDRLSEDLKQTMQVASVIGRDFAFRLLKNIMELEEEDLRVRLTSLVGLAILYEKALYPELEYIFKHALTQEVAYESLLKQKRQEIHGRIARAIEELYADRLPERYELLAYHYGRSGQAEKAIEYLILAGEKSNQNKAVQVAYDFFRQALKVVESAHISLDPEKERRIHQGLASVSVDIGDINTGVENYKKALEVCRKNGMIAHEMENLMEFAWAKWFTPMKREEVIKFCEEGMARAREVGDKGAESRILTMKGFYLAGLGYYYEGHKMVVEAEAMALQAGNQRLVSLNRIQLALTERWLGKPGKTVELTEGLTDALSKMFYHYQLSVVIFIRGLGLAEIGRIDDALELLKHGIDLCEKFGGAVHLGRLYNTLGYCYSEIHHPEEARKWNLKGYEIARKLTEQYPMGRQMSAEIVINANVNLMENLFDQGNKEEAWDRIKSFEEEAKILDYYRGGGGGRDRCLARLDFLASLILLERGNIDEARPRIIKNLEISRREHTKKIEGRFLRLLGEVQMERGEYDSAIWSLSEAIQILREVGNPRQLWQAHASLASVYDKLGRVSEAREQWGVAVDVIRKTAKGLSDRELREGFLGAKPIREILANAGR